MTHASSVPRLTLRRVLGLCARSLVHPQRAIAAIPETARVPYGRLIVMLMSSGIVWGLLHYRIVNGLWLFRIPSPAKELALATCLLAPVAGWLVASAGLMALSRWFGRAASRGWCDTAALCCWMAWASSLVADLVHPVFGLSLKHLGSWFGGQVSFVMHAGWFWAFPLWIMQLAACWRQLGGPGRWPGALAFGIIAVAGMRLLVRPLPELLALASVKLAGHAPDLWLCSVFGGGVLIMLLAAARWFRPLRRAGQRSAWLAMGIGLALAGPAGEAWAEACAANASGNWNAAGTWTSCDVDGIPDSDDTVTISSGYTVTVTADAAATSVSLNVATYGGVLVVDATRTLTLSSASASALNVSNSLNTATVNGTIDFTGAGGSVTNAGTVTLGSAGALKVKAAPAGAGTYTLNATSTVTYNSTTGSNIAALTYGHLTLGDGTTSATFTAAGDTTVAGLLTVSSTDTFNASSYTFTLSGTGTVFTKSGTFTPGTSTIKFTGAGSTVPAITYYHLTLDGSGQNYTIASGTLDVDGNLTITNGTLKADTNNPGITLAGDLSIANGGAFTNGSGTFTFNGFGQTWTDNSSGGPQNLGTVSIQ